jgi:hypothetical protein
MSTPEIEGLSFIIRIWFESIEVDGTVRWRGHITHVPSGNRLHLQDLAGIVPFIAPYLRLASAPNGALPGPRPSNPLAS